MPRFFWSPSDYSPEYEIESDGKRGFVKLHAIRNLPHGYPEAREIPIEQHYIDFVSGDGWAQVLAQRDWLGQDT